MSSEIASRDIHCAYVGDVGSDMASVRAVSSARLRWRNARVKVTVADERSWRTKSHSEA